MTPGTKITYTVSAGQQKETAVIESFETIYDHVTHEGDYEHARFDMHRYLFGRGFMNYEIIPVAYKDYEPGILLIIYVNGEEHTYAESVPLDESNSLALTGRSNCRDKTGWAATTDDNIKISDLLYPGKTFYTHYISSTAGGYSSSQG